MDGEDVYGMPITITTSIEDEAITTALSPSKCRSSFEVLSPCRIFQSSNSIDHMSYYKKDRTFFLLTFPPQKKPQKQCAFRNE